MVLLVLLCITFILNSVLLNRTKFARVIMMYYVGCFILVAVGIMYFVQFTNYSYVSEWDYRILGMMSKIKIGFYTLLIIHIIGVCVLMFSTQECVRLVWPMSLKTRLLLLIPIIFMFVFNLPDVRWYLYIKQNTGSYQFWQAVTGAIQDMLVLTAVVYYTAPIIFYIRYIFKTKIFVKKRYGIVGLASIILIDVIMLLLFIIGVFSPTMFYNMDLLGFPKNDMGVYYDNHVYIIIVFALMILNFVFLLLFTPFEKHGIANMQNSKKKNDALSNDVYMMLHAYKNRFLGTQKLATLALDFEKKGDIKNVVSLMETIKTDSMAAAEDISKVLNAINPVVMDYHIFSIESCIDDALKKCEMSNIKVIREYDGAEDYILGNREKIVDCFMNTLNNSVDAIEQKSMGGGEIRIRVYTEFDMLCVIITDNGCGIPKENMKKVFRPFFTTKEKKVGNGLGLDFVRRVARIHGGDAAIKSEEGVFTSVYTVFPCYNNINSKVKWRG